MERLRSGASLQKAGCPGELSLTPPTVACFQINHKVKRFPPYAPPTTMFCPSTWGRATMDSTHLNSEPKINPSFTYFCHTFCHNNAKVTNTTYSGELLCLQSERILICSTKWMGLKGIVLREINSHTYKIQYLIIFLT